MDQNLERIKMNSPAMLLLFVFGMSGCITASMVQDDAQAVQAYYLSTLPGVIGCVPQNLHAAEPVKTSGMCGSVDTMVVLCKDTRYICTMTSNLTGGTITMAGITQSAFCKLNINCSPVKN